MTKAIRFVLRWGYPWMILQWCCFHVVWAYGLLREPKLIESLVLLVGLDSVFSIGFPASSVAIFMISAAILALIALIFERQLSKTLLKFMIAPQYALVFAALLNDSWVLVHGIDGPTGTPVNSVIVQVLLLPLITSAIWHTFAVVERFVIATPVIGAPDCILEIQGRWYEAYLVR